MLCMTNETRPESCLINDEKLYMYERYLSEEKKKMDECQFWQTVFRGVVSIYWELIIELSQIYAFMFQC